MTGKGYDENGNIIYELINGSGTIKEYNEDNSCLLYKGEFLIGKGKEYLDWGTFKLIFEG